MKSKIIILGTLLCITNPAFAAYDMCETVGCERTDPTQPTCGSATYASSCNSCNAKPIETSESNGVITEKRWGWGIAPLANGDCPLYDSCSCFVYDESHYCAAGYYGNPRSSSSGCSSCPSGGTSDSGAGSISDCYITGNFSDSTGSGYYNGKCYY